jgi:hypothetical protein
MNEELFKRKCSGSGLENWDERRGGSAESWCVPFNFSPAWFFWTFLIAYSKLAIHCHWIMQYCHVLRMGSVTDNSTWFGLDFNCTLSLAVERVPSMSDLARGSLTVGRPNRSHVETLSRLLGMAQLYPGYDCKQFYNCCLLWTCQIYWIYHRRTQK